MAVDGSGRVHLLRSARLLHFEQQTFDQMLDGWRYRQLSRNLKFDTIKRIRYVRRFVDYVNEFPWHWTSAHVEEYFGDLRSIRHVSHSTLRLTSPHCGTSRPTSPTPTTAGTGSASSTLARIRPRFFTSGTLPRMCRNSKAARRSVPSREGSFKSSSTTPTTRSRPLRPRARRAGRRLTATP